MSRPRPGSPAAGRSKVLAWAMWDFGSTGLNAIVVTFVFSVYLTGTVGQSLPGGTSPASWLGRALTIAGITVAVLAPLTGVLVQAPHRRRIALVTLTGLAAASPALLRVKGVVRVAGSADLQIVQTTPGRGPTRADHVPFPGEAPPELGLTVIAGEGAAGRLARDLAARLDGPAPKVDVAALGLAR